MRTANKYDYIDGSLVRTSTTAATERDVRVMLSRTGGDRTHPDFAAAEEAFVGFDPKNRTIEEWLYRGQPESMYTEHPWLAHYTGDPDAPLPPEDDVAGRQARVEEIEAEHARKVFVNQRAEFLRSLVVDVDGKPFDADEVSQTRLTRVLALAESLTTDAAISYLDSIWDNANTMDLQSLVGGLRDALTSVRDRHTVRWMLADNTATEATVTEIQRAAHQALLSQEAEWFPDGGETQ